MFLLVFTRAEMAALDCGRSNLSTAQRQNPLEPITCAVSLLQQR
jgi:hypothetical protein